MEMQKSFPTVNLSTETLIKECSNHKVPEEDIFYDLRLMNRENIHDVFRYKKFNYDFIDKVTLYNDGSDAIGTIKPSYTDFIMSLCRFLNIPYKNSYSEEDLDVLFSSKVNELKGIRTELDLYDRFPLIYNDLVEGRKFIRDVERMEEDTDEKKARKETQRHYYYSCALKRGLSNFIDTQAELYTRLTTKRKEYKEQIEKTDYNEYFKNNFDMNKVAMYTTHVYLKICEGTDDRLIIKKYLGLINNYIDSSYDKSVSITTKEGIKVDINSIRTRIININKKINRASEVEWEIIRPGERDYSKVEKDSETTPKRTLLNYEELERLRIKGERKRTFYESTEYLEKAIGLRRYRGYIAYIYPNGEVILDTRYDSSRPLSATGDAIYNLKAIDFESLSKLDKSVLRDYPRVKHLNHTNTWEDRVTKIIERDNPEKEQEDAKKLVRKLRQK